MKVVIAAFPKYQDISIFTDEQSGVQTFTGSELLADGYNNLVDVYLKGFNYTLHLCNGMKGCVDYVSRNRADVLMSRTPDILVPEDQSAIPFQPMSQDGCFIISPYNCSHEKAMEDSTTTDITDTFHVISLTVWFTAIFSFLALSVLVFFHYKNQRVGRNRRMERNRRAVKYREVKSDSALWTVFNHSMLNPSFKTFNWVSKLISFLIILYVFLFIVLYLKNVIKTDQVRMTEQKVYRSFEEIVEGIECGTNITLIHPPSSDYALQLVKIGSRSDHVRRRMSEYLIDPRYTRTIESSSRLIEALTNRYDSVYIAGMLTTRLVKYYGCTLAAVREGKTNPDTCLHRAQETHLQQTINGMIASDNFSSKSIYKRFKMKTRKNFEAGIRFEKLVPGESVFKSPETTRLDCLSESIHTKSYSPEYKEMHLSYILTCLWVLITLMTIGLIALISELFSRVF